MKDKRIEEILSAAFGEYKGDLGNLTEAERHELETGRLIKRGLASLKDVPEHQLSNERLRDAITAKMSDAERREFEAGVLISEGLPSLKDVPEHQLSNERLRDAILGGQVTQRRRFAPWSFATATVAVVAIALVAIQTLNRPTVGNDRVVSNSGNDAPSATTLADNSATPPTGQSDVMRTNNIVSNSEPVVTKKPTAEATPTVELEAEYRELLDGGPYSILIKSISLGPTEEVSVAPAAMTSEREPVVVVDSATLSDNGAARAKEVASYGDVVFGG